MDVEVRVVSIVGGSRGGHRACGVERPSILLGGWAYIGRVVGVETEREGGGIWVVVVDGEIPGGSWAAVVDV